MQAGYSSVGRASDCRNLQQSDGPWFDSGWPDFRNASLATKAWCCLGQSEAEKAWARHYAPLKVFLKKSRPRADLSRDRWIQSPEC